MDRRSTTSLFSLILIVIGTLFGSTTNASNLSNLLDYLDKHVENRFRPGYYGGKPLEIQAFVFIRNIVEINEAQSSVTLSMLLMQMWNNDGLRISSSSSFGNLTEILIDNPSLISRLWSPDTFVVNQVPSSCSSQHDLATQVIRLSLTTGSVLKTSRLMVSVSCPMQLQNYPFHSFSCDVELESFGHKSSDVVLKWRNGSMSVDYSTLDMTSLATKTSYTLLNVETRTHLTYLDTGGTYTRLTLHMEFRKLWLRHAISFFIPTMALTLISILTLWLLHGEWAGAGIISNFIIAGFIILLGSLEYSTTPLLAQVALLTPVDFQLGICLSTVFAAVAYHGLSFCCCCNNKNSCCCDCCDHPGAKPKDRPTRSQEKSHEADSITYTKVTTYDSYVAEEQQQQHDDESLHARALKEHDDDDQVPCPSDQSTRDQVGFNKKLLSIFLFASKSTTTVSFFVAEFILVAYKYVYPQ